MAVQISLSGFHPGPHLAPPVHPYYPPPPVLSAPGPGTHHHQVTPVSSAVKPSAVPVVTSSGGAAGGGSAANQASGQTGSSFDGRRMRSKSAIRRTVDYNCSVANWIQNRVWQRDQRDMRAIQSEAIYSPMMVLPAMILGNPVNSLATRSVRVAMNKVKCPIFCTCWTPEGRRLVTGASSGEFTLWNGLTFSFETILQAHDTSVRAMVWSHNDTWMLTADHGGFVKYWQSNMNNVKMYQAHKDPIRGLSFCPVDQKFASCSDDGTVRIWDFLRCQEERILRGHGADVKCVDWHPLKGLVASGSKDTQQPVKLWDPRTGASLSTIHAHKHTVMDLKWNRNGNWLLTASRDHLLKIFDIRNMKDEMQSFRGHKKEATTLAWHPVHECLFASGGSDGAIMFWLVGNEKELGSIDEAHETMVWSMSWHPLGHILVSGSNDHTTKFWTRNRPGDSMKDRYNLNTLPAGMSEELDFECDHVNQTVVPGLGHEIVPDVSSKANQENSETNSLAAIPGLDLSPEKSAAPDADMSGLSPADGRMIRKKAIYTKPVPKDFERAWSEGRQPSAVTSTREGIPDERPMSDFPSSRPNFDNRAGPPIDMPHNPFRWQGHMRHPNPEADGPMNHDQSTPLLPNPEPMPPFHPGQGFPMGPQQGPPGGPRGPMQGGPLRGPMQPGPGPHNRMMHGMPNQMQSQPQHGMMPPPRPPLGNQPIRGPMGPPGPGGPRPLLSLPFQDRDVPPGGGHGGGGHGGPGTGRGAQLLMMPDDNENEVCHSRPTGGHFEDPSGEDSDIYRKGPGGEFNEFSEIPDHNGHFDKQHQLGDIDYRSNNFRSNDGDASQMHQEPFPNMGPDVNARGNWRRPRGAAGILPHPGPPSGRNYGPPPNSEHFAGPNKPPSLLDMKLGPAPSSSMGMKRKWDGAPPDDDPEFLMPLPPPPPSSLDGHPPGPFGINPEMCIENADNWPPPESSYPPNVGRGRGNFFRGEHPGRGLPRGRPMRGGGRGR